MLLLTSALHHCIESNGGSLNQRERFSQTSLPPVIVTEVSDDFIKTGLSARLISEQQKHDYGVAVAASSVSTGASVTGTGQISPSSVIPLSLAGNDLIILQMNRDINLFHKHFLCKLIKTVLAELTEKRREMMSELRITVSWFEQNTC